MARKLPILDGQNRTVVPFTNIQVFDRTNTTPLTTVTMNPLSQAQAVIGTRTYTVYTLAEANPYKLGITLGQTFFENVGWHFVSDIGQSTVKVITVPTSNVPVLGAKTLLRFQTNASNPPTALDSVVLFSGSWTVPAGITRAKVTAVGGGGGGGGARFSGTGAAGGAGGGTVIKIFNNLIPGTTYNFYIGNGGWGVGGSITYGYSWPWPSDTGSSYTLSTSLLPNTDGFPRENLNAADFQHGGNGYCTFFNGPTPLYAFGGMGGTAVTPTSVNNSTFSAHSLLSAGSTQSGVTYTGGGAYGGDINIPGEPNGHGGGAYHGTNAGTVIMGGKGGNSAYGMGASANYSGTGVNGFSGEFRSINGQPGRGYGAGGSGGASGSSNGSASAVTGGTGSAGAVIIEW